MKLMCSFFVVFIHYKFPGAFGQAIDVIARVAVPFFFLCSGYFSYYEEETDVKGKMFKKIKRSLLLLFAVLVLYFLWDCFYQIFSSSGDIIRFFREVLTIENTIKFFCFNYTGVIADPFWFLSALLYCYIILLLIQWLHCYKFFLWLVPFGLLVNIVMGEILPIWNIVLPNFLYRNFLFMGLPFVLAGYWIHVKEKKLKHTFAAKYSLSICFFGIILSIVERVFLQKAELYLGSIFASIGMLIFALGQPNVGGGFLSDSGKKYSLYIFCTHWFAIQVVYIFAKYLSCADNILWQWSAPLIVCIISVLFSKLLFVFKKFLLKKLKN